MIHVVQPGETLSAIAVNSIAIVISIIIIMILLPVML